MRYEIPKAWKFNSEEEVKEYAESVLKAVGLDSRYTFFFIEKGKHMGVCKPIEKKIGVALKCVQHFIGNGRIQHIVDTILHEVAHALVCEHMPWCTQIHGKEWKMVCRKLGMENPIARFNAADEADRWWEVGKKVAYKLILDTTGEVIATFIRKPRRDFSKYYVKGKKETQGHLVVVKA